MARVILLPGVKLVADPVLPRCQMKMRVPPEARGGNRALGNKCGNFAKVAIDGKNYCIRCAGRRALEILLTEQGDAHA